ncbi:class I adenylate-forming enzyme family protein [Solwaraspora sp. WMMD1047]|uniref:class I adenylate-forming enzyme family protein n=1 Tax=Solwaraspora sp. WMMD1047 TaxID=3016102 RepID=UPI002416D499|nr:class I adenylate-forming enzyme family protein [Solwaraspora sp. WMMD1047]MDG4830825.1 class I adenylate-forming enzyme family protein [Solwaraspora sp. WMMD1047]
MTTMARPVSVPASRTVPAPAGRRLTRSACAPTVDLLARHLTAIGVVPGDRVLLLGENDPGYLTAMLALIRLDVSLVLVDARQTAAESVGVVGRAGVRWALLGSTADLADTGRALTAVLGVDRVRGYDELIAAGEEGVDDTAGPASAGAVEWARSGDRAGAGESAGLVGGPAGPFGAWAARRDAALLWSSGTTGRPKGVVRSARSLIANTLVTMRVMGYRPDDVLFPLLPFSHQYGMSLVLIWWLTGCSLLVAPYRRLADALDSVREHRVTAVDAAPPTYHALLGLLERRPATRAGLASVRMWCVGGAPLPPALADRFAAELGAPLLDGYGLSEVGNVALATADNPVGCGKPLPGVSVRIAEPAGSTGGGAGGSAGGGGAPPPPGSPDRSGAAGGYGEVQVRSAGLMEGYLDEEGRLRPVPDGWFGTGDLGRLDEDGNLHVVGRHRAVHRMGYTLYPESIQRQAEACGAPICLVSVDDERRGCQLVLFVEDPQARPTGYWRDRIDALLASYERPNAIEVLPRLPVGSTGKVDRAQLTELAARRRGTVRRDPPAATRHNQEDL